MIRWFDPYMEHSVKDINHFYNSASLLLILTKYFPRHFQPNFSFRQFFSSFSAWHEFDKQKIFVSEFVENFLHQWTEESRENFISLYWEKLEGNLRWVLSEVSTRVSNKFPRKVCKFFFFSPAEPRAAFNHFLLRSLFRNFLSNKF